MAEIRAEILCLGNELLIGRTVNKNATDISLRLTREGIKVTRVTTVRDELEPATAAFSEIISRSAEIICITGGLGPTFDDIQLDIIAKAINRPLEEDEAALNMVQQKYQEMNEARRKMALIPAGSTPLPNSVGSAPGVVTRYDNSLIFSLPGVPREMRAIMDEEVLPIIRDTFTLAEKLVEYSTEVRGARESDISDIIDQLIPEFPEVSFKSHPRKDDKGYYLVFQTYAFTENSEVVREALLDWIDRVRDRYSIDVSDIESKLSNS